MRQLEFDSNMFDYLKNNLKIELNQKPTNPDWQTYSVRLILTDAFGEQHIISETKEFTTRF